MTVGERMKSKQLELGVSDLFRRPRSPAPAGLASRPGRQRERALDRGMFQLPTDLGGGKIRFARRTHGSYKKPKLPPETIMAPECPLTGLQ